MNEKLRKIINHYTVKKQLKYFQSEVFELNEAILNYNSGGILENVISGITQVVGQVMGVETKNEFFKDEKCEKYWRYR